MAIFIVERNVSERLGDSAETLATQSRQLPAADNSVVWQRTYVTEAKIYSLYTATNAETLRQFATRCGYTIHRLLRVHP